MRKLGPGGLATEDDDADIDLTPMLDVVFIMLIFFIVTATFVKEFGIDVNNPDKNNQQPQTNKVKKNILVQIDNSNQIWINKRSIDIGAVRANIERLYAQNPEASVIVQPQKKAKVDLMIRVMDSARDAGIYNVSIAEADEAN